MSDKSTWGVRLLALILILVFTFLFWHLYATLVKLNREIGAESSPQKEKGETKTKEEPPRKSEAVPESRE